MSVLRGLLGRQPPRWMGAPGRWLFGRDTILENNTTHAVASTGESLAGGVIFTVPALIFLQKSAGTGQGPSQLLMLLLGLSGGFLGLLMMIPLRRHLMVQEAEELPFPEGTACAKVLIAGDRGGASALEVVAGGLVGAAYVALTDLFTAFRDTVTWSVRSLHQATIGFQLNPLMLGVGYLIGLRASAVMFIGGVVGWVLLLPAFDWILQASSGAGSASALAHQLAQLLDVHAAAGALDPDGLWSHYVRYVGAGGVAMGGFLSLARSLPSIANSFLDGIRGLGQRRTAEAGQGKPRVARTDRDLPTWLVGGGVAVIGLALWLLPPFQLGWLEALLAVAFSFFFVVVASRMVGLIGTTSQPVSGMTIAALLCTCFILSHTRGTGLPSMLAAMTVGVVVCIAISLSGDLSQDLKTCTILGGTPWVVQTGQMMGTLSAALRAGWVLWLLDAHYHLGSPALPAPQATLMATLVQGAFGGHLPWGLLTVGALLALVAELVGWGGLNFSIGLYLPVATSASFIFGGLIQWALRRRHPGDTYAMADERATLLSSGLIAGYALMGIALAFIAVASDGAATQHWLTPLAWLEQHAALRSVGGLGGWEDLLTILPFAALTVLLWRRAQPVEGTVH